MESSLDCTLISTQELERIAAHLRAHNELFPLDEHERADLDAVFGGT